MAGWVEQMVEGMGYWGLALLTFLENVFPPIPSEVIMPLGGFLSSQGQLNLVGVVLSGVVGSVAGAIVLYYLGQYFSEERVTNWVDNHGYWLLLTQGDVEGAFRWFERHGKSAVFFCRLIPGVRSLISIPAGACGMPLGSFLLYTTLGTTIWSGALAYAGRALGQQYQNVSTLLQWATYAVVGLTVLSILWYILQRRRERQEKA